MPKYPVKQLLAPEKFTQRIFFADPWADEIPTVEELEEKYGKKMVPIEDTVKNKEVESMEKNEETSTNILFDEKPIDSFNSW